MCKMLNSETTAFVFPGQGSQVVGMGAQLAETSTTARNTFEVADELLGFHLSKLCFEGPQETLTDTVNAQPALYVTGIATLRVLNETMDASFLPAFVAGHSLGELTALTAAGALSFPDGLRLVRQRGVLMRKAGEEAPGGMAALLGIDLEAAEALCAQVRDQTGGTLVVANDNCPGQIVIAGDDKTLDVALERAKEAGARRAIRLPVSIAAHSPLMASIAAAFCEAIEAVHFDRPQIPVIGNVHAEPLTSAIAIREELGAQLTSPVRWTASVRYMLQAGVTTFVELGSKDVLTGLLRRIDRDALGITVNTSEDIINLMN
jgi:[acyl-carrier-protein] S-malonyltransferase